MSAPPIAMLAVDVDGTLVARGDHVTEATRAAMRRATEHLCVVLATGRRYRSARLVLDRLGLDLPVVCLGGALTKDASGETLHSAPFDAVQIDHLLALAHDHGLALVLQRDAHKHGGADFVVDAGVSWNAPTAHYVRYAGDFCRRDPAPRSSACNDALVAGCFAEREALAGFEADIVTGSGNEFATVICESKKTPGWYLEIIRGDVSKWTGIARYAERASVPARAVCAVGDAANDLPMIRAAGLGVAMGNADDAIKRAAHRTIGRNDEDGLAVFIDELIAAAPRNTA